MFNFEAEKSFSYIGQFWYPNNIENKFPGSLSYEPKKGLKLKILQVGTFTENESTTIHGFVEGIKEITLFNCVGGIKTFSISNVPNKVYIYDVHYSVVGLYCNKEDEIFDGVSFHFPELNSFCIPNNSYFVSDDKPLYEGIIDENTNINIEQGRRDKLDLFHILTPETLEKVAPNYYNKLVNIDLSKYTEQEQKERDSLEITKPFFCINIRGKNKTIGDYLRIRKEIEQIFSLFLLTPVYSDFSKIISGKQQYQIIEPIGKIKDYKKLPYMFHMPINIWQIKDDFVQIFSSWKKAMPSKIITSLINDKIYNNSTPNLQQLAMIINVIASWQKTNGEDKTSKKKYENFFVENLQDDDIVSKGSSREYNGIKTPMNIGIQQSLFNILGKKSCSELGKNLSSIRNCILHFDEKISDPKQQQELENNKNILENDENMMNLCEVLFFLLVYAIYKKIGIVFEDSQKENFLRKLKTWKSISY